MLAAIDEGLVPGPRVVTCRPHRGADQYNAKLTFGTDVVGGSDANLQTKELVAREKRFSPFEVLVQATS